MKFRQTYLAALITSGMVVVAGCSVKNNMGKNRYQVEPEVLEVNGDSVAFTVTAIVPEKSINPKANIRFEPVLKTDKGETALRTLTVGGESAEGVDVKINSKTGGKVSYTSKFKYSGDMRKAKVMSGFSVKVKEDYKSLNELEGVVKEIAQGTITTSYLVRTNVAPKAAGDAYAAEMSGKSVEIYFPQDKAKFDLAFGIKKLKITNKAQVEELKNILKKDPKFVPANIKLTSFASPDGELERNGGLAKSRSESSYAYFQKELKKLGFAQANDSNFTMGYEVSEDWDGVRKAVEASTLADKNEMLVIINNKGISDDQREESLRNNHRKSYDWLISDVFPKLRRSSLTVMGSTPLRTEAEIIALAKAMKFDSLNASELYHLGYIMTDADMKLRMADYYITRFPEDWRAYNDKAVLLMFQAKWNDALTELVKANKLAGANEAMLQHNAGICMLNMGNRAKAEEMFTKANASYGLGVIAIQKGNYADAINYFNKSGVKDGNVALAYLLNKQTNEAKSVLESLKPEQMNSFTYYLMAIVGARSGNVDMCTTNLSRSLMEAGKEGIDMNAAKKYAADDLEFRAFFSNPNFQAAVK